MVRRAGVYVIKGTKSTRVGQSRNTPERVKRVIKEYGPCIGKVKEVQFHPKQGVQARRNLEKRIIDRLNPRCNSRRA